MPANKFNPVAGEILVNTTVATGQQNPAAAYLSDGRFVVVWTDGSDNGGFPFILKGQLFDTSGNKSGGEFVINNDSGDHQHPSLTALSTGGFVAVWMGGQFGYQTQFQIFDSSMNKVGSVVTAQNPMITYGIGQFPDVTALANGNFVIAWMDIDGYTEGNQGAAYWGTFAQTFSPTGTALNTAHLVNSTTTGEQNLPSVSGLAAGGHVVVWQDHPTASSADGGTLPHEIRARTYASDGTAGAEILVNTTTAGDQRAPEVEGLAGGGFVVVWTDASATGGDTSGSSVRAQVYDDAGNKIGGEILVNSSTAGNQYGARVAALPSGAFIIAWVDSGPEFDGDTDGSIRAQVFNADGSRKGDEGLINSQVTSEYDLVIDVRADGSFALSWGEPDGTGFNDVKARFFAPVVDDPAVAQDDAVATTESSVGTGSLFADHGLGADFDPDGPGLSVAAVNGVEANVGQAVTLASGAIVTVLADGTYSYDPNGQFNGLADASSGAVNTTAIDSFAYTLANGNSATVSVTINGVASPGDVLFGDGSDNGITGSGHRETFMLHQGGNDSVLAGAGNDFIYFGSTLGAGDAVDGGGGNDTLSLLGAYTMTFGASQLVGIERLVMYSGSQGGTPHNSYNFTTIDANVAAGNQLAVVGRALLADEQVIFNGAAESDGTFLFNTGLGNDVLVGGQRGDSFTSGGGDDQLFGLGGDDWMYGGAGGDSLRGGVGHDGFIYRSATDSIAGDMDRILDFQEIDRIDLSAIDADGNGANGNTAFTFIGGSAFGNVAGQLRAYESGGSWYVEGDVNGDGTADLIIQVDLAGLPQLGAGDFVL